MWRDSCNLFNLFWRFASQFSVSDPNGLNIPVIHLIYYGMLWILAACSTLSEPVIYLIYYEILRLITTARKATGTSNLFNLLSDPRHYCDSGCAKKPVIYLIYYWCLQWL